MLTWGKKNKVGLKYVRLASPYFDGGGGELQVQLNGSLELTA